MTTKCLCGWEEVEVVGVKDGSRIGKCKHCKLIRAYDWPEDADKLYTEGGYHERPYREVPYAERYESDYFVAKLRWPKLLSSFRLLDVGCANGAFVAYAIDQGIKAEGFELAPDMAAWARRRTGATIHTTWDTVKGEFDIITYHDVIEHIENPVNELADTWLSLRPGGLLVLDTPDAGCRGFKELGVEWHHIRPQEHRWYFNESQLRNLVERVGYVVVGVDRPIPGKLVLYARRPE